MLFLETTDVAIRDMNVTKTEKSEYAKNRYCITFVRIDCYVHNKVTFLAEYQCEILSLNGLIQS